MMMVIADDDFGIGWEFGEDGNKEFVIFDVTVKVGADNDDVVLFEDVF